MAKEPALGNPAMQRDADVSIERAIRNRARREGTDGPFLRYRNSMIGLRGRLIRMVGSGNQNS